jgi:hypothetical protein
VVSAGLLVASCSSTSSLIADSLPDWAGGLPRGTPPRAGEPGYDAYQKSIRGDAPATASAQSADAPASAQPVETPASSRKPEERLEEPIH